MSVATIGPSSFVTCFELVGATGFEAESGEDVVKVLKNLIDEDKFKLIILPERFAKDTLEVRTHVMKGGKISPVFALIPDLTGKKGMRLDELRSIVSLAIGAKLEV